MSTPFKRKSTFSVTVSYVPLASDPADLSSTTVTSSVMDGNGNLYTGAITKAVDNRSFTVIITAANTSLWTLGENFWDVKFIYAWRTFYSATEILEVEESYTP